MTGARRSTPLLRRHRELGARLVDFAGWEMPLQYKGVVAEHNAVRNDCGIFDVSHLGKLRVTDGGALQEAVTCDVQELAVGRARYGLCLTETGGCVDDVFVYRLRDGEWLVVPNAANVAAVAEMIEASGGDPVDEWDRWAILAIQGPRAYEVFLAAFPGSGVDKLKLHRWNAIDVSGEEGIVARTGYTGEKGVELYAPASSAEDAFDRLTESGAEPCGLGARDTLRLEMGYALYGHELTLDIDPLQAGLGWAIAWERPFRGKEALEKIREEGPDKKLVGIRLKDRGVPRQGYEVSVAGTMIGQVCSGNFSPTLGSGIALAYVEEGSAPDPGDAVVIEARGRTLDGVIVEPPFVGRR